jgi:Tfp pilus assembly protein PilO
MPRSQAERLWMIGGGVAAFLMILVGYLFFISPQQDSTSEVNSQVRTVQSANDALEARLTALAAQNRDLTRYQSLAAHARAALPDTSALSAFLRTVQAIGSSTHTSVTSLAANNPVDVSVAAGVGPKAGRVYALPITMTVTGAVPALDQFMTQLQSVQPRAVLISQLTQTVAGVRGSTAATATGKPTAITMTMYAFVAPSSATEAAQLQAASAPGK